MILFGKTLEYKFWKLSSNISEMCSNLQMFAHFEMTNVSNTFVLTKHIVSMIDTLTGSMFSLFFFISQSRSNRVTIKSGFYLKRVRLSCWFCHLHSLDSSYHNKYFWKSKVVDTFVWSAQANRSYCFTGIDIRAIVVAVFLGINDYVQWSA